jgi:hypothetical protein
MNLLPASNQIPAWQIERARKLHRACLSLQSAIRRGETKSKALRRVARNFNGRKFKSNPARHMALCAGSLKRLFKVWQRGGEVPSALIIQYHPRRTDLPAPLLVRFVEFCACISPPNLKAGWQKFSSCRGSFGPGRRAHQPLKTSYQKIRYHLAAAGMFPLLAQLRAIAKAQTAAAVLRFGIIAELRRRLPDRPPRQRPQRGNTFEI